MNDALTRRVAETAADTEGNGLFKLVALIAKDKFLEEYCFLGMAYGEPVSDRTMAAIRTLVAEAMIQQRRYDAGEAQVLKNLVRRLGCDA